MILNYIIDNWEDLAAVFSCNNKIPNYMTGEDVVQDLAERFIRQPPDVEATSYAGFVFECGKNIILDAARKENGRGNGTDEDISVAWGDKKSRNPTGRRVFLYSDYNGMDWEPAASSDLTRPIVDCEGGMGMDDELAVHTMYRRIEQLMEELPPNTYHILMLSFGFIERDDEWNSDRGFSLPEIAGVLGISKATVSRRKTEGLAYIREGLEGY